MKSSKHDWTFSGTATSLQFFLNPFPSAKSFQFMNFSEAMCYENYLTSDFQENTVISRRVCLLVKLASKTVIRPIVLSSFDWPGVFKGKLRRKITEWIKNQPSKLKDFQKEHKWLFLRLKQIYSGKSKY